MPVIAEFDGIRVEMYYDDHPPPHIHVRYGGAVAQVDIATFAVLAGTLPLPVMRRVRRWGTARRDALARNWERAQQHLELDRI